MGDPFLIQFDTSGLEDDPARSGCDAASQFFPHGTTERGDELRVHVGTPGNLVIPYENAVRSLLDTPAPEWTALRVRDARVGTTRAGRVTDAA